MKQLQRKLHFLEKTTYFLILLFLPTQLGKHFWPTWSYVSGLRIDYLSPTVYLTDIFIILLFTVWAINKFSNFNFQFSMKISNFKFRILLIAVVLIIGVISSNNPMAGWYGLLKLGEFIFFGWYTAKHVKSIAAITMPLAIGVLFASLLAIVQVITQGSIGGIFYWFGERTFTSQTPGIANASVSGALFLRPYATFSHPNVLAGFLAIAMTAIIFNRKNTFYILALILGTLALFLTFSRVAILLWIAMVIVNFLMRRRAVLVAFFLIACAIALSFTPLPSRFLQTSFADESLQLRISLSQNALSMVREHPIFGVGLNNFISTLPSYQHARSVSLFSIFQPVHNIFLLVASQTGIFGFIFFLWFIFITCKKLKFQISNFKFQILCVVLILGMFDHYFLTLQQGQLLFALVFGLCFHRS